MSKRRLLLTLLLGLTILLLAACGGQDASSEVEQVAETAQEAVEQVEEEAAAVVEETAVEAEEIEEAAGAAGARTFIIVPEQSQAAYKVDEEFFSGAVERLGVALGLTETVGKTNEVSGQLDLDLAAPSAAGEFVVNIRSLTSNQSRRDERIREQWLESNQFPEATFVITSVDGLPADYQEGQEVTFTMNGDMTIREITNPENFDVTATLENGLISGVGTATLKMSDYGFEAPVMANFFTVGDEFVVEVTFVAQEG